MKLPYLLLSFNLSFAKVHFPNKSLVGLKLKMKMKGHVTAVNPRKVPGTVNTVQARL